MCRTVIFLNKFQGLGLEHAKNMICERVPFFAQLFLRSVMKINNSANVINSPDVSDCLSVDIVKL